MKILMRTTKSGKWRTVEAAHYKGETELQQLLAEEPSLISIGEVREGANNLVAAVREFPLDVGYIDILGFTAEGDIAVIECKLASNDEIKRKVIGQVLEYGAGLWNMDYEELDGLIKTRIGKPLAEWVRESVSQSEIEWDEEAFRYNIEDSLRTGSFVLIIVVDEVNERLSRVVRYLNEAGQTSFSLAALEMRRFQHDQVEMLIPHVYGTVPKKSKVSESGRRRWDEATYFADAFGRLSPGEVSILKELYEWSKKSADLIRFGTGVASASFSFLYNRKGVLGSIFSVYSNGTIMLNYGYMDKILSQEEIAALRQRMLQIPTFKEAATTAQYYYSMKVAEAFAKPEYEVQFQKIILEIKFMLTAND